MDMAPETRATAGQRLIAPLLLAATLAVAFFPAWQSMAQIWWTTVTYHHGFVVAPVALALIWMERKALAGLPIRFEPLALVPLAGFACLWLLGEAGAAQLLQHIGVVGLLVSGLVAILGRHIARVIAFPLLFLFFMVPFGDFLVPFLQDITARFSVMLLRALDIPVFHNGIMIDLPNGRFEVAEACAGIRFLIANVVVAAVFAHLSYRRWWKWLVFMALAVVIPILANGLRAFGIILIAHLTDNEYAVGVDHLVYGWGFFTVVMLIVLFVGNLFADKPLAAAAPTPALTSAPRRIGIAGTVALAVIVLAPPAYAYLVMRTPADLPTVTLPPPPEVVGWTRVDAPGDWQPQLANTDARAVWAYRQDAAVADLAIGYWAFERQGAEAVYHANRMADNESWTRIGVGRHRLSIADLPTTVQRERMQSYIDYRAVLWWYWIGGSFTADTITAKLLQVRDRLLGRHRPAAIVALSARYADSPEEAHKIIEQFLASGVDLQGYLSGLDR